MPRERFVLRRTDRGRFNSTDRTVEIATGLGAKVFAQPFTDYVRQKQIALDHATSEWVLLLDADEQATHDLGVEILETRSARRVAADGYRIRRVLYHLGHYYTRPIYRDRPVRLFRRDRGHIGGIDPHDKVIVDGRIERLKLADPALQLSRYRRPRRHDQSLQHARRGRNGTFGVCRGADVHPCRSGASSISTSCAADSCDGGRGLYAAMTAAFYVFLKYAKAYERRLKTLIRADGSSMPAIPSAGRFRQWRFYDRAGFLPNR